jgi:hypothetical protein
MKRDDLVREIEKAGCVLIRAMAENMIGIRTLPRGILSALLLNAVHRRIVEKPDAASSTLVVAKPLNCHPVR